MSQHKTTTRTIVGFALISAGAVMAAIGAAVPDPSARAIVAASGTAVLAAGLVSVVGRLVVDPTRSIVMGAVMIAAGVIGSVAGVATGDPRAAVAAPAVAAAIATGGILAVIDGAHTRASHTGG